MAFHRACVMVPLLLAVGCARDPVAVAPVLPPPPPPTPAETMSTWNAATKQLLTQASTLALATAKAEIAAAAVTNAGPALRWFPSLGLALAEERVVSYGELHVTDVRLTGLAALPVHVEVTVLCHVQSRVSPEVAAPKSAPPTEVAFSAPSRLQRSLQSPDQTTWSPEHIAAANRAIAALPATGPEAVTQSTTLTYAWDIASAGLIP